MSVRLRSKLTAMGVVDEEDVRLCRELFRAKDANHDGALSDEEAAAEFDPATFIAADTDSASAAAQGSAPGFGTPQHASQQPRRV